MKRKLLKKHYCGHYIFSHRREATVVQLCEDHSEHEVKLDSLKVPKDNLRLFPHAVTVEVLYQFMRYVPDTQEGEHDHFTSAERTIVSLARFDLIIITLVSCVSDDGQDTVGGHGQEVYPDAFADALPNACRQLIGKVCQYAQM